MEIKYFSWYQFSAQEICHGAVKELKQKKAETNKSPASSAKKDFSAKVHHVQAMKPQKTNKKNTKGVIIGL